MPSKRYRYLILVVILFLLRATLSAQDSLSSHREWWLGGEVAFGILSRTQEGPGSVIRGEEGFEVSAAYIFSDHITLGGGISARGWNRKKPAPGMGEDLTTGFFAFAHFYPYQMRGFFITGGIGFASVSYADDPTDRSGGGLALRGGIGYEVPLDARYSLIPSITSTWTWISRFPASVQPLRRRTDRNVSLNICLLRYFPAAIPPSPEGLPPTNRPRALVFNLGYCRLTDSWKPYTGHFQFGMGGWTRISDWPFQVEMGLQLAFHKEGSNIATPPAGAVVASLQHNVFPLLETSAITGGTNIDMPGTKLIELKIGLRKEWQLAESPLSLAGSVGVNATNVEMQPPALATDAATALGIYVQGMVLNTFEFNGTLVFGGISVTGSASTPVVLHNNIYRITVIGIGAVGGIRL